MRRSRSARFAGFLLDRLAPDSEPLAGDLIEGYEGGRSAGWLWVQVVSAIAIARAHRRDEIRPLRLVDAQPAEAIERTRRMQLRFAPVNMTGSPVPGVGGLGLVALGLIVLYATGVIKPL